jgi:hypothetical protein
MRGGRKRLLSAAARRPVLWFAQHTNPTRGMFRSPPEAAVSTVYPEQPATQRLLSGGAAGPMRTVFLDAAARSRGIADGAGRRSWRRCLVR